MTETERTLHREGMDSGTDTPDADYIIHRVRVPRRRPDTDKALLDEVCGCLSEFALSGAAKNLRIAMRHIECLLILSSIDWSTGHPEVDELTWDGQEPIAP